MKYNKDLGSGGPCCPDKLPEKWYPSVSIDGKEPLKLPEAGTITFRFKKTSSSETKHGDESKYHCTLELQELVSAEASEAPKKRDNKNTEEALDSIAKSRMKSEDDEDDEEEY